MFFFIILTILVIIMLLVIFKSKNLVLFLISLLMLFIYVEFNFYDFILRFINILDETIFELNVIALILATVFIYLISELLIIIGVQNNIEQLFMRSSIRNQKILALVFSALSTNIDLSKSVMLHKYDKIHNQSLTLTKSVNIFSTDMIALLCIFIVSSKIYGTSIFITLFITNFFAFFFFFKRIIDFRNDVYIDYKYHESRINLLDTSTEVRNVKYPGLGFLFSRVLLYFVIILALTFIFKLEIYYSFFLIVFATFIDLFISSIIFSQQSSVLRETYVYSALLTGLKKIVKPVTFIIVSLFYVVVMTTITKDDIFIFNFGLNPMIIVISIVAIFASYILYNAIFAIVLVLPLFSLFVSSTYFDTDQIGLMVLIFGLCYFVNHLSVLKTRNSRYSIYIDISFQFICCIIAYMFYLLTGNILYSYLIIFVFLFGYFFFSKLFLSSDKI